MSEFESMQIVSAKLMELEAKYAEKMQSFEELDNQFNQKVAAQSKELDSYYSKRVAAIDREIENMQGMPESLPQYVNRIQDENAMHVKLSKENNDLRMSIEQNAKILFDIKSQITHMEKIRSDRSTDKDISAVSYESIAEHFEVLTSLVNVVKERSAKLAEIEHTISELLQKISLCIPKDVLDEVVGTKEEKIVYFISFLDKKVSQLPTIAESERILAEFNEQTQNLSAVNQKIAQVEHIHARSVEELGKQTQELLDINQKIMHAKQNYSKEVADISAIRADATEYNRIYADKIEKQTQSLLDINMKITQAELIYDDIKKQSQILLAENGALIAFKRSIDEEKQVLKEQQPVRANLREPISNIVWDIEQGEITRQEELRLTMEKVKMAKEVLAMTNQAFEDKRLAFETISKRLSNTTADLQFTSDAYDKIYAKFDATRKACELNEKKLQQLNSAAQWSSQ